jgi:hypothetical protein
VNNKRIFIYPDPDCKKETGTAKITARPEQERNIAFLQHFSCSNSQSSQKLQGVVGEPWTLL